MEERVGDGGHIVSNRMTKWKRRQRLCDAGEEGERGSGKKCIGVKSDLASFMAPRSKVERKRPTGRFRVVSAPLRRP
jgi:hypothetical protein